MKRVLCIFLVIVILTGLFGCSFGNSMKDEGIFYYRRANFLYGNDCSVLDGETRDITGHAGDLSYLVALYLVGPMEKSLVSPFPKNTRLLSAKKDTNAIFIELSDLDHAMSDAEYSLACACLTLTCLELVHGTEVTITSGDRSVTMTRDALLLFDGSTLNETTTEETQ